MTPQAATAGPGSAVLRSIAGPAVRRIAPVTKLARVPSPAVSSAAQATGRGAAAASGSFRGRRAPAQLRACAPGPLRLANGQIDVARREGKSRVVSIMLLRTPAAVTTEK